jgi:adenylyltransferase/sulfurtransferase
VVLDCTDNFTTRFLVHDACLALNVPLVQAAVHRFEGTLDVFRRNTGGCLHCQWLGRIPSDLDTPENCSGGPVFGPAVGVLGLMQAAETIKLILGHEGEAAHQTRLINLLDGTQLSIGRSARPDCPVCGRVDQLVHPADEAGRIDQVLVLDSAEVRALGPKVRLIFLTEPGETSAPPAESLAVPAHDLARLRELAQSGPLVLACRHGLRSAALARLLRAEGVPGIHALAGAADLAGAFRHD